MMQTVIKVRHASPADIRLVRDLIHELAAYERLADECRATVPALREMLFGPRALARTLLGFVNGRPAGFAVYYFTCSTFLAKPVLYLEDLFVKPELRGVGCGRELFFELLRIARNRRCGRLEWAVLDWNQTAIEFYERLGAKPQRAWVKYRLEEKQIRALVAARRSRPARSPVRGQG